MNNTEPDLDKLIRIGKIVSVYGVKGWVKVFSYTDPRENLFSYTPHWIAGVQGEASGLESIELDEGRVQGRGLVAHIKGVDDRDQARAYCQREIFAPQTVLDELEAGEYYWHQLVGLKIFSSFEGKTRLLGTVDRMMETGANDVMVVTPCEGSIDKRERLLPFLLDHYDSEINLEAGTLSMNWDPEF